jgi:hypothetical protein
MVEQLTQLLKQTEKMEYDPKKSLMQSFKRSLWVVGDLFIH